VKRQNNITQADFSNFLQAGALLRYGSDWILAFGRYTETSPNNNEEISVFCPDFYQVEEGKALSFSTEAKLSNKDFLTLCRQYLESHTPEKSADQKTVWEQVKWQDPDLADFTKAFSHTQQLIGQGQIDKAVPFVAAKAQGSLNSYSLVKCLIDLAEAPTNLYVYGFWKVGEGIIGATPEILFEKKGKSLATMALAGTMAKASDARGEQLLKNKKELHENELVATDIKQQLRPLGMVRVEPPTLLELPTLWHLISRIELKLEEEVPAFDLIKRLHPTPALGVSPRRFGWRWMREWPQQNSRARFGAPFLMKVEDGHWLCLVAIRNLQWNTQEMMIGSGCGVVRDSELEREWLELFYKRESVKKVLGIKS
jgi:menaquinone-specific isochorismate synthase